MNYKLSLSDFAFLYEECKRCYYLKVKHNISRPSTPLPSIFSKIAGLLKNYYDGKQTEELHTQLPLGVVCYGEKNVKSDLIRRPGHSAICFIKGRFDIVAKFDDGSYGVIDFKTGNPDEENHPLYSRQLHAYVYALEHPAQGALRLLPISKMGLLYFYPSKLSRANTQWLSYDAEISWVEVKKDEQTFLDFIGEALEVLGSQGASSSS